MPETFFIYPGTELWKLLCDIVDDMPEFEPAENVLDDILLFVVG